MNEEKNHLSLPENAFRELKPGETYTPCIPNETGVPEVTRRSIIFGIFMIIIFSAAASYIALKLGQGIETAIPIGILAVGFSAMMARKSILIENVNILAIGATSGILVGGSVFVMPAIYMLGLQSSSGAQTFFQIFLVPFLGAVLGVLFLIPFRKYFTQEMHGKLPFPEATATTEILVAGEKGGSSAKVLVYSLGIGIVLDYLALAFRTWSDTFTTAAIGSMHFFTDKVKAVFAMNTSAAVLGLGVIIGVKYASIIMAGSLLSFFVLTPLFSYMGSFQTPESAQSVAVSGDYAYVTYGEAGLKVINLADSTKLKPIGYAKKEQIALTTFYKTLGSAGSITISGSYAGISEGESGVEFIDITTPNAPTRLSHFDTPGSAAQVLLADSLAYVADGDSGVQILNVAVPAAPVRLGGFATPGSAVGLALADSLLYIADFEAGLRIINVANTASPAEVSWTETPGRAKAVAVYGNYAYVVNSDEVKMDTSRNEAGELATTYTESSPTLRVYDITNPAAPVAIQQKLSEKALADSLPPYFQLAGVADHIILDGHYAYVSAGGEGLRVIDLTYPDSLLEVNSSKTPAYLTPGSASQSFLAGPYVYVAGGLGGLSVLNRSNPQAPSIYGRYNPQAIPPGDVPISSMSAREIFTRYARLMGIGGIFAAGLISILKMSKVIKQALQQVISQLFKRHATTGGDSRLNRDIPMPTVFISAVVLAIIIFLYFRFVAVVNEPHATLISLIALVMTFLIVFLFSAVSAWAIAMISVTPISGMTITTLIISAVILAALGLKGASGMLAVLLIGGVVCTALSMSGSLVTQFKIGQWLGSTPRTIQWSNIIGSALASLTITAVIILFAKVYGFGTPSPEHPNPLPAPQASAMAAVANALLGGQGAPWMLYALGAFIAIAVSMLGISPLAFALGMYLPIELNSPILLGACVGWMINHSSKEEKLNKARGDKAILIASGLIAGGALAGVFDALTKTLGFEPQLGLSDNFRNWAGLVVFLGLALFLYLDAKRAKAEEAH